MNLLDAMCLSVLICFAVDRDTGTMNLGAWVGVMFGKCALLRGALTLSTASFTRNVPSVAQAG